MTCTLFQTSNVKPLMRMNHINGSKLVKSNDLATPETDIPSSMDLIFLIICCFEKRLLWLGCYIGHHTRQVIMSYRKPRPQHRQTPHCHFLVFSCFFFSYFVTAASSLFFSSSLLFLFFYRYFTASARWTLILPMTRLLAQEAFSFASLLKL